MLENLAVVQIKPKQKVHQAAIGEFNVDPDGLLRISKTPIGRIDGQSLIVKDNHHHRNNARGTALIAIDLKDLLRFLVDILQEDR